MKTSIAVIMVMVSLTSLAQNSPIDFESNGHGADWTWTTFENDDNPPLSIEDNPDKTGINASSKVAKFTARLKGNPWAGCESKHGADIGKFTLSPSTSTVTIMVYKSVKSDVGIKLVDDMSGSLGEIKVANTKINTWEELTFDLSTREGIEYDQIVIFMDFDTRTQDNICYFDNVTFGTLKPLAVPTVAAADPTQKESNVISLFSDVYTNVPVNTWKTDWSSAALSDVVVDGNNVKRYSSLDFVGIETTGDNLLDISGMKELHFDMWTPNSTLFKIKLVDFGADGKFQGGDGSEHELEFASPKLEEWQHFNISLSDFSNLKDKKNIAQIILASQPIGESVVYIDNLLFSNEVLSVPPSIVGQYKVFPNPSFTQITVSSETEGMKGYKIYDHAGQLVREEQFLTKKKSAQIQIEDLKCGIYYIKDANGAALGRFVKM